MHGSTYRNRDSGYHEWGSICTGRNSGVSIQWTTVPAHNNESVYRAGQASELHGNKYSWNDVFENGNGSSAAGVHAELNVDNMGRFMILEDTLVQLTADDPVKTMRFNLPGSKVGSVRYNIS